VVDCLVLRLQKDCDMKKKLLVLLIAAIPLLIPNLASAVAVDIGGPVLCSFFVDGWITNC
jgi:hypothetical protein